MANGDGFEKAQQVLSRLNVKMADLQDQVTLLTKQTLNVESLAGKRVPFIYSIPITVTQGIEQLLEGSVQTSRAGPFFADRLLCNFRIEEMESGGDASLVGRDLPLSSKGVYPYMWPLGATGTQCDPPPLDFEWGYESDSSDRQRQDRYVPGDFLDRQDNDGILSVSDIFPEGSTITFKINPLRPVGNNAPWSDATGVESFLFTASFWGYKIIQPTQV